MKKTTLALLIASSSLLAVDGATVFKKCAACHGMKAEKKALGKSNVIAGWDVAKLEADMKGYRDGTRNIHGMGVVMKGQMASLSDADMKAVATHIHDLK